MTRRNPKLSRRDFLKLAGITLAGSALGSCGVKPEIDSQPVQLVYQDWRTDWFPAMAQEIGQRIIAQGN